MFCEIHNKSYQEKKIEVMGFTITTACPLCTEDMKKKEMENEKKELELSEKKRIESWARIAKIPAKYANFEYKLHPKHENIKVAMNYKFDKNLICVGSVGCGKTKYVSYLAMLAIKAKKTVAFTIGDEINTKLKEAQNFKNENEVSELIAYYSTVNFLILDEIDELTATKDIFTILNNRYNNNLATILLGNINLKEDFRQIFGDKICDRIKENLQIVAFTNSSLR